ncbi:MAG: hypothetical protein JEY99_18770 [Spirochaetales bacterium]|nr:hypothetical protein [Spirochaetales bacterium]
MKIQIPQETIDWLNNSEIPRVRFKARSIFEKDADRQDLFTDPLIKDLIASLMNDWDEEILKQHNKPDLCMHRFCLLADSGVRWDDKEAKPLIDKVLKTFKSDSLPRVRILIPKIFRGSGEVEEEWIICDYPQILYGLLKMGVNNDLIKTSLEFLATLSRENGYPCTSSMEKFRGPGNKSDFCPIASLYGLKALNLSPETRSSEAAENAAKSLLTHWEKRGEVKHYLFGIGTDFRKLKYPLLWYNLFHVLSVLSQSNFGREDSRTMEMGHLLLEKADDKMRFTPESMYRYYKDEDFANKKEPSPTLTITAIEIFSNLGMI